MRCGAAGPAGTSVCTKPQLALDMLTELVTAGSLPVRWGDL